MSNPRPDDTLSRSGDCPAAEALGRQRIVTRDAVLGEGLHIRRALPVRQRRMVGAWCFLDHFGPADLTGGGGLRVGPHPHTGLQTFTWLLEGEILHRDSLGSLQRIAPGQVNLMTAGRGISHSEESPPERGAVLHGTQLWIALPDSHLDCEPAFEHHPQQPRIERDGVIVTLAAGRWLGEQAPARVYTPLVGAELRWPEAAASRLPLEHDFEYGLLPLIGEVAVEGEAAGPGSFIYLGPGRDELALRAGAGAVALLVGGRPFASEVLLWWNFVGRDRRVLARHVRDWNAGDARFGEVRGYDGPRLVAPTPPWPPDA